MPAYGCAAGRCFNPRPPFPGGDASTPTVKGESLVVSIHAPRFREAMRRAQGRAHPRHRFQSTPPVSGRRCGRRQNSAPSSTKFQSTPPVSGRRCHQRPRRPWRAHCRFNPRPPFPGGDAGESRCSNTSPACFNPRPPFPGGDAPVTSPFNYYNDVSIHAPRFREAMPLFLLLSDLWCECFNPRPPFPGGDALKGAYAEPGLQKFQSTPPVSGRRCSVAL